MCSVHSLRLSQQNLMKKILLSLPKWFQKIDEAIIKQTSSAQKRVIKNYSKQKNLGNHMIQTHARNLQYSYLKKGILLLISP